MSVNVLSCRQVCNRFYLLKQKQWAYEIVRKMHAKPREKYTLGVYFLTLIAGETHTAVSGRKYTPVIGYTSSKPSRLTQNLRWPPNILHGTSLKMATKSYPWDTSIKMATNQKLCMVVAQKKLSQTLARWPPKKKTLHMELHSRWFAKALPGTSLGL